MWKHLFFPITRYFSLRNRTKTLLDVFPTIVFAGILTLIFVTVPGSSFFRPGGFLSNLIILTSALTGFYVAALVASATFNLDDLDRPMQAGTVVFVLRDSEGERIEEPLTRREFVCAIFGYLSFATFFLSVLSAMAVGLSGISHEQASHVWPIGNVFAAPVWPYIRGLFVFFFSLLLCHIGVVTMLGLYYLMDRLYRRDRHIVTKKRGEAA